jgi:hypothetical protein
MLPPDIYSKPWARPPQYNRESSVEPDEGDDDQPAPERSGRDAVKPASGSTDTEPLVYRKGNPEEVFGVDDNDEE